MMSMESASNSGYDEILGIAEDVREEREQEAGPSPWEDSPWAWFKLLASAQRGSDGGEIITRFFRDSGITLERMPGQASKWQVDGLIVQIKCSTKWENGTYRFQQFRRDPWDVAVCFGISTNNAHCWVVPRETMEEEVLGHRGQHTGNDAEETDWLGVDPEAPEPWLDECGGSPDEAMLQLRFLAGH